MPGNVDGGAGDSSDMSQELLPRHYPTSHAAAAAFSESSSTSGKRDGNISTSSSNRQVEMDALHVKSHAFSMKWFRKLRDVSRLFIAVDTRSWCSLVALCFMQAGLIFLQSLVGPVIGNFYSSIIDSDAAAFGKNVRWALFVFACISIADAALKWLSECMEVKWRRSLATQLHIMYIHENPVASGVFCKLDNPDQRLAAEVTQFCSSLSDMLRQTLQGPMLIVYYTCLSAMYSSWVAPSAVWLFFFVGAVTNRFLLRKVVGLTSLQGKLEGDFRLFHVSFIRSIEQIWFLKGLGAELHHAQHLLSRALANRVLVINQHAVINCISNIFAYFGSVLNYSVVAVPVFAPMLLTPSERWGSADPGTIAKRVSETSFYCLYLVNGFSVFVNLSSAFGDFAGCTSRIHEMLVALTSAREAPLVQSVRSLQSSSRVAFAFENACFGPPLLQLCSNMSVALGERVLLSGPSGSGKTSIFRALTGLWPVTSGSLGVYAGTHVICVPQLTHAFSATLLELVIYPLTRWEVTQEDFKLACDAAAAAALSPSMLQQLRNPDCERDWAAELSSGELQRVGFARLLFSCAAADCDCHLLLLLDEATSSLPPSCEKQLYGALQEWLSRRQGPSTVVTVSHRPELQVLHDRLVLLPLSPT
jgi:ABC-type uncharacterized transport system fused permease/ATPase subunit